MFLRSVFSANLMMINMHVAQYTTIYDLRLAGKLDWCQSSSTSMMEKDAASEMYARCFLKWYDKIATVNSDVITPLSKLCAISLIQCVFAASQLSLHLTTNMAHSWPELTKHITADKTLFPNAYAFWKIC